MKIITILLLIFWALFTWCALHYAINGVRTKKYWHAIWGGIAFLSALFILIFGIIKLFK